MVTRRDSNCPLCGASLTAAELLDAGTDLISPRLGVFETHCPHCQGYLEVMPVAGRVDVGYLIGPAGERFDVALALPFDGLVVEHTDAPPCLKVTAWGHLWEFGE
jgi:hypothetical protein